MTRRSESLARSVIVVAAVVSSACASSRVATVLEPVPDVELTVYPQPAIQKPPVEMIATLIFSEPVAGLECADVSWDWGDGSFSKSEPKCSVVSGRLRSSLSARHRYQSWGQYEIRVRLSLPDRRVTRYADFVAGRILEQVVDKIDPRRPPKLKTVLEAKLALSSAGSRGSIFVTSTKVFVSTPYGCGEFTKEEWERFP